MIFWASNVGSVSTHSRPKAAAIDFVGRYCFNWCFNTQPPEGGCRPLVEHLEQSRVSTHSRPKAAAING